MFPFPIFFSSGGRLLIGMLGGQMLILEYLCADYIPPIVLKYLDRGLMSILARVHLSIIYHQTRFCKPVSDLAVSPSNLGV